MTLDLNRGRHDLRHSPNLRGSLPRQQVTSVMAAARATANRQRVVNRAPVTPEQQARELAAEQIAARRRSFWESEHPGANYYSDQEEYLALGRELCEAGLGEGLSSQWLAMCCSHYRAALDGGAFKFLDTHQTELQRPLPGMDPRMICVRCGATVPRLNREACRGDEIYRERRAADRVKLGSLVELFSELGG